MKNLKFWDAVAGFVGTVIGGIFLFKADTELAALKIGFLFIAAAIGFFCRRK